MQYDYGQWWLVALNFFIFFFFIKASFKPQSRTDWRSFGVLMAFIAALSFEMYGFPLTIFLLTSLFGNRLGINFSHDSGHLLSTLLKLPGDPHFNILHIISNVMILAGIVLLGAAWKVLYQATKKHRLATTGPYAFIRHPQYLSFILIIAGFLLQWPTILTLLMAPILIWRYLHLGRHEEKLALDQFKKQYKSYQRQTPAYIPSVRLLGNSIRKKLV